jgi:hypothetical protein
LAPQTLLLARGDRTAPSLCGPVLPNRPARPSLRDSKRLLQMQDGVSPAGRA